MDAEKGKVEDKRSLMQAINVVEKHARGDAAVGGESGARREASLLAHRRGGVESRGHARAAAPASLGVRGHTAWGVVLIAIGFGVILFSRRHAICGRAVPGAVNSIDAQGLKDALAAGELPSVVVVKGELSADGPDVTPAAPSIPALFEAKNVAIASQVLEDDKGRMSAVQQLTGLRAEDVPDEFNIRSAGGFLGVDAPAKLLTRHLLAEKDAHKHAPDAGDEEPVDVQSILDSRSGRLPCVLAEALVARLGAKTYKVQDEHGPESPRRQISEYSTAATSHCEGPQVDEDAARPGSARKVGGTQVVREERGRSYSVFHARQCSKGLHIVDAHGYRIDLELPDASVVKMRRPGEQPSLFLATGAVDAASDANHSPRTRLASARSRKEGPAAEPAQVDEPTTMLSKFIFMDVQSNCDLVPSAWDAEIAAHYGRSSGGKDFLWEPKGFYDHEGEVPPRATFGRRELVSADELFERAKTAAEENPRISDFCQPAFTPEELAARRDQENCFRFTELAIPRGSQVTVLARPEPDGRGGVKLVPPSGAESGRGSGDPEAERYRLRILRGNNVEDMQRQQTTNCFLGFVGVFLVLFGVGAMGMRWHFLSIVLFCGWLGVIVCVSWFPGLLCGLAKCQLRLPCMGG